jgi:hypothetical protein
LAAPAPVPTSPLPPVRVAGSVGPKLARAAGLAGLVFAALLTITFALLRVGMPPADPASFDVWWAGTRDRVAVGTYLLPFAGMAFIWFTAALRRRIGTGEGLFFSTVYLSSALLFTALLFAMGAAVGAVVAAESLEVGRLQAAATVGFALAYELFFGFAVRMAAMFMLAVASIGRGSAGLPRWVVAVTLVLGLVALIGNTFVEPFALIFPAWAALVSFHLVRWPGD